MKISIETILRANAMGIARNKVNNKMMKDSFYSKMMQLSENEEILDLMKDKKKLNTAYKKARDSIKNR